MNKMVGWALILGLAGVGGCAGVEVCAAGIAKITGPDGFTITAVGFEDALQQERKHITDLAGAHPQDTDALNWWKGAYADTKAKKATLSPSTTSLPL